MDKKSIPHMIRFPDDVYAKLRTIAKDDDRSVNWEVVAAVKLLIADYEQRNGTVVLPNPQE